MTRSQLQADVTSWGFKAFGEDVHMPDRRILRLCEEVFELAQVVNADKEQLKALIDYVYAKPVGDIKTELGDVGISLMAFASSVNLDATVVEANRAEELFAKDPAVYTERMNVKKAAGF